MKIHGKLHKCQCESNHHHRFNLLDYIRFELCVQKLRRKDLIGYHVEKDWHRPWSRRLRWRTTRSFFPIFIHRMTPLMIEFNSCRHCACFDSKAHILMRVGRLQHAFLSWNLSCSYHDAHTRSSSCCLRHWNVHFRSSMTMLVPPRPRTDHSGLQGCLLNLEMQLKLV